MQHVMIDLETMGRPPRAAIVQIGAVEFDLEAGTLGEELRLNVTLQSNLDADLPVDGSTVEWWLGQSDVARAAIVERPRHRIEDALRVLSGFLESLDRTYVWGDPSTFDAALLLAAYKATGQRVPWHYRNVRDLRTLKALAWANEEWRTIFPELPNAHDALVDARRMAEQAIAARRVIRGQPCHHCEAPDLHHAGAA